MVQTPNKSSIKKAIQDALSAKYPTGKGQEFQKFSEFMTEFVEWTIVGTDALDHGCIAGGGEMSSNNVERLIVECADSLESEISELVATQLTERVYEYLVRQNQGDEL